MRGLPALLLPLLLLSPSGCASKGGLGEGWTFALSREFYPSLDANVACPGGQYPSGEEGAAVAYLALLALPLAIDLVALPVTVTRDLIVAHPRGDSP